MWKEVKKPLPARHVISSVDTIEEVWGGSSGALDEESASSLRRDLFTLVGIVRGLAMALELRQPDFVTEQEQS